MYFDNIEITQNFKKGEVAMASYKIFVAEDNIFSFTDLPEGIYVVRAGGKVVKVVVR